jgi:molecular chaperone GrpE
MSDQKNNGEARHHRTRAEERIAALGASPPRRPEPGAAGPAPGAAGGTTPASAEDERLTAELEAARREAADMRASWQRSAADFANYKRRTEQEREATLGLASEMLLLKLLSVVDDFDRALASMPGELSHLGWIDGLWLVERKLRALLESEGVTPIESTGQPFDPHEHEAAMYEETTKAPDGTVIGELQRGYRIRDRVLRPALVAVAKNPGREATSGGND